VKGFFIYTSVRLGSQPKLPLSIVTAITDWLRDLRLMCLRAAGENLFRQERTFWAVVAKLVSCVLLSFSGIAAQSNPSAIGGKNVVANRPQIPDEVRYKTGYVNPVPAPANFSSVLLWGIAIADTLVRGYESAQVEVASTRLSCRVDGREVVLNDDGGQVRGGLYRRLPWFGTDAHDPMPLAYDLETHSVVLHVGQRAERVWHFWSPSPRAALPPGKLEGCTVRARVRISAGALLQMGMDYWRSPTVPYGAGGNNHEASASDWYFASPQWQEATFTDSKFVRPGVPPVLHKLVRMKASWPHLPNSSMLSWSALDTPGAKLPWLPPAWG
jgi:hypothetical protein